MGALRKGERCRLPDLSAGYSRQTSAIPPLTPKRPSPGTAPPGDLTAAIAEVADTRAVPGQPAEIAAPQDSSTSDCGRRHPVQLAIRGENLASPPACRLLLWEPEELLQVREIVVRATSRPRLAGAAGAAVAHLQHLECRRELQLYEALGSGYRNFLVPTCIDASPCALARACAAAMDCETEQWLQMRGA
jgi:hypothetical protein